MCHFGIPGISFDIYQSHVERTTEIGFPIIYRMLNVSRLQFKKNNSTVQYNVVIYKIIAFPLWK